MARLLLAVTSARATTEQVWALHVAMPGHLRPATPLAAFVGLGTAVFQDRLRHGSAKTTPDTYGRMWPDSDESARAAVGAVLAARADSSGTASAGQA